MHPHLQVSVGQNTAFHLQHTALRVILNSLINLSLGMATWAFCISKWSSLESLAGGKVILIITALLRCWLGLALSFKRTERDAGKRSDAQAITRQSRKREHRKLQFPSPTQPALSPIRQPPSLFSVLSQELLFPLKM